MGHCLHPTVLTIGQTSMQHGPSEGQAQMIVMMGNAQELGSTSDQPMPEWLLEELVDTSAKREHVKMSVDAGPRSMLHVHHADVAAVFYMTWGGDPRQV